MHACALWYRLQCTDQMFACRPSHSTAGCACCRSCAACTYQQAQYWVAAGFGCCMHRQFLVWLAKQRGSLVGDWMHRPDNSSIRRGLCVADAATYTLAPRSAWPILQHKHMLRRRKLSISCQSQIADLENTTRRQYDKQRNSHGTACRDLQAHMFLKSRCLVLSYEVHHPLSQTVYVYI